MTGRPAAISVIIPHLNQPDRLARCLASLQNQKFDMVGVEIIIVDNGSREAPRPDQLGLATVIVGFEAVPGPGPARNKGVTLSTGSILAFIDSDCVADENWLSVISDVLNDDSGVHIIGGDVSVTIEKAGRPTPAEAYERIFAFRQQKYIESHGYSATLNLALRRSVFDAVGPFGGIDIAEDRDWGLRAGRLGYRTAFVPRMIVAHPARRSLAELRQKWDRMLHHDFATRRPGLPGHARWLARACAVAVSPMLEAKFVLTSPKALSWRERGLAAIALTAIRLYRARKMLHLQFATPGGAAGHGWNRG